VGADKGVYEVAITGLTEVPADIFDDMLWFTFFRFGINEEIHPESSGRNDPDDI